ncbi:response regulator transcription factor [Oceanospirillum linum]|uniref:response regulator transcription factor n=1 Tax=Oceanospirillum linum TaxID=966 RepID=UPI00089EC924|nr:response regulator [Oceanospirillum linum]SEF95724.1 Two-component response regulator, FixJ family, consists of REC and HTH domains [Oleiphilus messinensis]SMP11671.1 two component transcriptional regulator, LuxR family [Oceanospirillum linum]
MQALPQKIHIIDDTESVAASLQMLLESYGYDAITHSSGENFLHSMEAKTSEPCCLLLDVRMQGMSGIELFQQLESLDVIAPVIFITGHATVPMAVRAIQLGAFDFLEKPIDHSQLIFKVESALKKFRETKSALQIEQESHKALESLTKREYQILELLVKGCANKEVARELNITVKTVEYHRSNIMRKTAVNSLPELVRLHLTYQKSCKI